MGFLEKTGKNVDEALEQALNELKTTRDKVISKLLKKRKTVYLVYFLKKLKFVLL